MSERPVRGRYCRYLAARAKDAAAKGDQTTIQAYLDQARVAVDLLRPSPECERCVAMLERLLKEVKDKISGPGDLISRA